DFVFVFEREDDARRVFKALPKRLERFGLTLHPSKTRLLDFRRPDRKREDDDGPGPRSFDLLGFTHYWGLSRNQKWLLKKKTAKDRLSRALRRIREWCRLHRHDPVKVQHRSLVSYRSCKCDRIGMLGVVGSTWPRWPSGGYEHGSRFVG